MKSRTGMCSVILKKSVARGVDSQLIGSSELTRKPQLTHRVSLRFRASPSEPSSCNPHPRSTDLFSIILLVAVACSLAVPSALGQTRYEIQFPDILGYKTLKCDFHTHTVFSDGVVWPTVRVEEAWREGLDAVAITDHIEYKPHDDDVSTDHGRPFAIAEPLADELDVLLPLAAEITRDTPPGHFNAIFLENIEPLDTGEPEDDEDDEPVDTESFVAAVRAANEQGAFVFWNHPGWQGPELGNWREVHELLYKNKWFHGIEVVNGSYYYRESHEWCLEKNLTMLGTSDIHDPSMLQASTPAEHRTMTLVFAEDRSLESLKNAMFAGRTVVWSGNQLIGRKKFLDAIYKASVDADVTRHEDEESMLVRIRNTSDIDIKLRRSGGEGPARIDLAAGSVSLVEIETGSTEKELTLDYTVENFLVAPGKGLAVKLTIPLR